MAADTTTSRAPDARFLFSHPAHFIALGFGAGLSPWMPGTAGTLLALPLWWMFGGGNGGDEDGDQARLHDPSEDDEFGYGQGGDRHHEREGRA